MKRGVKIINRVTIIDLLLDHSRIVGAVGTGTRDEEISVFKAGAVVLATGICTGLYPGPTPAWPFNKADPPSTTGEGRAMAFRAGAELVNMEIPRRWAGPRYFARCGKGSWIGVVRGPDNKPVGPFVTDPDRLYGDAIGDFYPGLFEEQMKSGKGPVYMDCRGLSDEDFDYMMWGLSNEGNTALIDNLKDEHIDIRKNAVEFMTYELSYRGGILFNKKTETSLPGLYAVGDEYFGAIGAAATFGWVAGNSAATFAVKIEHADLDSNTAEIAAQIDFLTGIRGRDTGASWQEVSAALGQIMLDYAGVIRSGQMLEAGLDHVRRLKIKTRQEIMARNQHELMHCLEVLSLLDIGETVFVASLARQETRGSYVRVDYPYADPRNEGKVLVFKLLDGTTVVEWREVKQLN